MERFDEILKSAGKVVRRWWLGLILGVLLVVAGIVVFCNPVESYMALSVMFGVLMLLSGLSELVVSLGSRNYFMMRGYSIVGGILDLLLGIFLCVYPQVTLVVLPVVIGIWLLYHSFMIIGFGGDLSAFRLPGLFSTKSDNKKAYITQCFFTSTYVGFYVSISFSFSVSPFVIN